jgi:hypothetical protein
MFLTKYTAGCVKILFIQYRMFYCELWSFTHRQTTDGHSAVERLLSYIKGYGQGRHKEHLYFPCTYLFKDIPLNRQRGSLASTYLSVCPSVCPQVIPSSRFPLDTCPRNLIKGISRKPCQQTPNLLKIRLKYRALHMKSWIFLLL